MVLRRPKEFNLPEFKVFRKLNTAAKVQNFIDRMPMNFRNTCESPLTVLQKNRIYCLDGAFLAAAVFWYHGRPPLVLCLQTVKHDFDHMLALFKENGRWGAVSKTNHPVLRYREPVYKNIRELAMSYFHEYFMNDGKKTMRGYSDPLDLRRFGTDWLISKKSIWHIDNTIAKAKYHKILDKGTVRRLRRADKIEINATKTVQWRRG